MKLAIALFLFSTFAFAAPPTLGPDCGAGATIEVTSSRDAGKLVLGAGTFGYYDGCTLTFSWPGGKAPSCFAMLEQSAIPGEVDPGPYSTVTTGTTLFISNVSTHTAAMQPGFKIAYGCIGR